MKSRKIALIFLLFVFTLTTLKIYANDGTYIFDKEFAKTEFFKNSPESKKLPPEMQKVMFDKLFQMLGLFTVEIKDNKFYADFAGDKTVGTLKEVEKSADKIKYIVTADNPKPDQKPAYVTIQGKQLMMEGIEAKGEQQMKALHFIKVDQSE